MCNGKLTEPQQLFAEKFNKSIVGVNIVNYRNMKYTTFESHTTPKPNVSNLHALINYNWSLA